MINVWDYQEIEGKVKVTCIDGQVIIGNMGDINDAEDEAEDGFTEDSIDIYRWNNHRDSSKRDSIY